MASKERDERKAMENERQLTRLWRIWRTVHEMVADRVCFPPPSSAPDVLQHIRPLSSPPLFSLIQLGLKKAFCVPPPYLNSHLPPLPPITAAFLTVLFSFILNL